VLGLLPDNYWLSLRNRPRASHKVAA
jgi:hypothetical protein